MTFILTRAREEYTINTSILSIHTIVSMETTTEAIYRADLIVMCDESFMAVHSAVTDVGDIRRALSKFCQDTGENFEEYLHEISEEIKDQAVFERMLWCCRHSDGMASSSFSYLKGRMGMKKVLSEYRSATHNKSTEAMDQLEPKSQDDVVEETIVKYLNKEPMLFDNVRHAMVEMKSVVDARDRMAVHLPDDNESESDDEIKDDDDYWDRRDAADGTGDHRPTSTTTAGQSMCLDGKCTGRVTECDLEDCDMSGAKSGGVSMEDCEIDWQKIRQMATKISGRVMSKEDSYWLNYGRPTNQGGVYFDESMQIRCEIARLPRPVSMSDRTVRYYTTYLQIDRKLEYDDGMRDEEVFVLRSLPKDDGVITLVDMVLVCGQKKTDETSGHKIRGCVVITVLDESEAVVRRKVRSVSRAGQEYRVDDRKKTPYFMCGLCYPIDPGQTVYKTLLNIPDCVRELKRVNDAMEGIVLM